MDRAKGIDVSRWDPVTDWAAVKGAGISFVGMKATEGNSITDPKLTAMRDGFRANDFALGIYFHFARSGDPVKQANRFLASIGALKPNERLALDFEVMLTTETNGELPWIQKFIEVLKEAYPDRDPILYTSDRIWRMIGNPAWLVGNVDLWVPRYNAAMQEPTVPKPWTGWKFWQWTDGGQTGPKFSCPGVGPCDASYFNGDEPTLIEYAKLTPSAAPAVA